MRLCRVQSPIVSNAKHPAYEGQTLFCVAELDDALEPTGGEFVAVDRVQAGEGDVVLVLTEGTGARQLFGVQKLPLRSVIVGIVDQVST